MSTGSLIGTNANRAKVNRQEVERAFRIIVPDGEIAEIRALNANFDGRDWAATYFGFFDDASKAADAVVNLAQFSGVYFTLNKLQPELIARASNRLKKAKSSDTTSDSHVTRRRWVLVDCDAERVSGISSSDSELALSREFAAELRRSLSNRGFPEPIVANSGNGFHLLYRVDLPVDDEHLVERFLQGLAAEFDTETVHVDQAVFNPSRICKLYGTLACKGDPTHDRPHRMARIVGAPADTFEDMPVVNRELLESVAVPRESVHASPPPAAGEPKQNGSTAGQLDGERWLAEWIDRHGLSVSDPKPNRGGTVFQIKENPLCDHAAPDVFLGVGSQGGIYAKCSHNSCSWSWRDLRQAVEKNGAAPKSESKVKHREEEKPEPVRFKYMTSAELDAAEFNIEYLVERLLVAGQPCVLSGPKKCLKTSMLIDLSITVATGGKFLGYLPASRPARVALMSGESGMPTLQETARRIASKSGYELADLENLIWSDQLPRFADIFHLSALAEFIKGTQSELLIIDPAYLCMPSADAGNLMAQGELLRGVSEVCQKQGATLVLAHHSRKTGKADPYAPPELEDMAWAGFQEFVRQWILLGRRDRFEPGSGLHRLWLISGGSMGHSGMWGVNVEEGEFVPGEPRRWDVSVIPTRDIVNEAEARKLEQSQEKRKAEREAAKEAILKACVHFPEGDTKSAIRDATGRNSVKFNSAFSELVRTKELVACEIVKGNNQTYEGYKRTYEDD